MFKKYAEVLVGLFMMAGLLAFITLSLKVSGLTQYKTGAFYHVDALFDNIGGLKVRAPVRIAGVRVGEVGRISLDPKTYRAQVTLLLDKNDQTIPIDSSASILTEGLLGANYISLTPGFEEAALKEGSHIEETNSAMILENMIGHFLFSLNNKDKSSDSSEPLPNHSNNKPLTHSKGP